MKRLRFGAVLCACLAALAGPLHAAFLLSASPRRLRAVYLDKPQFDVHADGVGDDAAALQQAIDRAQIAARAWSSFREGRYRLSKTVYVWKGIRLIGYGARRPVLRARQEHARLSRRRRPSTSSISPDRRRRGPAHPSTPIQARSTAA